MLVADKNTYFELIKDFEYIPFPQSEGWYHSLQCMQPDKAGKIVFLIDDTDHPRIGCFGYVRKLSGMKWLSIDGECLKNASFDRKLIQSFYEKILSLSYDCVEVNSLIPYSPEYETGIRKAGYLRPVGLFSIHLSKTICLQEPVRISRNWKRNLKKAENENLKFEFPDAITKRNITDFIHLYNALTSEKNFSHTLHDIQLEKLFTFPEFRLANVKDATDKVIVSFIIRIRNGYVEPLYIAKAEEAKNNGATFFMYVQLLEYLKHKQATRFDIGRLLPTTLPGLKGVFDFKDSIEGEYVIYNGEWSFYKKKIYRPLMYFVKRYGLKKREV